MTSLVLCRRMVGSRLRGAVRGMSTAPIPDSKSESPVVSPPSEAAPIDPIQSRWREYVDNKSFITYYTHKSLFTGATWRSPKDGHTPKIWRRLAATGIDISFSFLCGMSSFAITLYELEVQELAGLAAAAGFTASFILRDIITDNGTRSVGKKLMKLEIVMERDGTLPRRVRLTMRNMHLGVINISQELFPVFGIAALIDSSSIFYRKDGRRLADLALGTTVVNELPLRKERVEARQKQDDEEELADTFRQSGRTPYAEELWWQLRNRHRMWEWNYKEIRKQWAKEGYTG